MTDILIRNITALDPDPAGLRLLRHCDIAIEGNKIARVVPSGSEGAVAARVIEGEGRLAIPGLINNHAHAAMVLFRGAAEDVPVEEWFNSYIWPMEANLTADDVYFGALLAAVEMIEGGITTVADHYFHMDRVAQALSEAGLRGHLAWTLFGSDPEAELSLSERFASQWQGAAGGRIQVWLGPHAPYTCPTGFLAQVAALARDLQVGCHIHVSETAQQVQASLATHGVTPIQLLDRLGMLDGRVLLAHAAHATQEDLALLEGKPVGIAHCPKTFLKLAAGIAPVVAMRERGIPVGLGTDGAASNNTLDILEQMRLAAMMQKHQLADPRVIPLAEAVAMATVDGARALGAGASLGRIAPGYLADIAILRLDVPHAQPVHNLLAALV
jgi:5-methylthioadenosine/S-adenosylhomocysteine deaminase